MSSALVPVVGCPDCGSTELHSFSWIEEPLVRGGGYGEARMTTTKVCPGCGWEITAEVASVPPQSRRKVPVRV